MKYSYKYIIAYMGQFKPKPTKPSLADIEGFAEFTPEVEVKLKHMFNEGKINSFPSLTMSGETLIWRDKEGAYHRDGNLPAVEHADGSKKYFNKHVLHRTNGPASIGTTGSEQNLIWALNGRVLAEERSTSRGKFYFRDNSTPIGEPLYQKLIKQHFPDVGNKIHTEDWISQWQQ